MSSKKLIQVKKRISKHWSSYQTKKENILSRKKLAPEFKKGLVDELLDKTKQNIKTFWQDYQDLEYASKHKSDIPAFKITKVHRTQNTIQKTYKAGKSYNEKNLDKLIPKLLKNPKIAGVSVILQVYDEEQERVLYVSDFITRGLLKKMQDRDESIYEHVADKAKYSHSTEEFELKAIHIRIVYEKA
jgi:hypothetical protein